jgi:CheY-like chemotaxis protein
VIGALAEEIISGAVSHVNTDTRLVRKDGGIVNVRLTGSAIHRWDVEQIEDASAGYQVRTAASAREALAILADPETQPDLLLTDVVMPGMTGEPFAARVRAVCPGIRILARVSQALADAPVSGTGHASDTGQRAYQSGSASS